jgi:CheY-like chemotaxis protein
MTGPVKILIAEDNYGDVVLVRAALQEHKLDFELMLAEHGDMLIDLLEKIGNELPFPDLVMLDLNVPRMQGPELFRRVRSHPACANLPLVVISSSDSPKDRAWTSQFGVSHYFRKPSDFFEFLKLGAVVRGLLTKQTLPDL